MLPDNSDINDRTDGGRRLSRRRFIGGSVLGLAGLSFAGAASANQIDDLQVIDLRVEVPGWPREANGYAIAQLSDLHADEPRAVDRVRRGVELLMMRSPDVAVITGDFVSDGGTEFLHAALDALQPLIGLRDGAFAVLGNHDFHKGTVNPIATAVEARGIRMLRNQSAPVPGVSGTYFIGVDDVVTQCDDIVRAVAGVPPAATRILLVHEPDFADSAGPGFALQISGHSHGGQIRLPGLPPLHEPPLGREYPEGLQQAKHHQVYTSRGVGVTGPKLRLYCRPDVTLLRLHAPSV